MSNIFERNFTLKIISVIFAIILWLYATGLKNPERSKIVSDISVEVRSESLLNEKELMLVDENIKPISIRVRGRDASLKNINRDTIKAYVDVSHIDEAGKRKVPVFIEGVPSGLKVERQEEVSLNIERILSWDVPLDIRIDGTVKEGFQIHSAKVSTQLVRLRGPESQVKKVAYGMVTVDIGNNVDKTVERSSDVKFFQVIAGKEQQVKTNLIQMMDEAIVVTVPIYPEKKLRVDASTGIIGTPAEGYEIADVSVYPQEITVNGEEEVLNQVETLLTEAIDIQGVVSTINKNLNILPYPGVYINPGQPSSVVLVIRIQEKIIEKEFVVKGIQTQNLSQGRTASVYTDEVTVNLKGPYTIISDISPDDIQVFIDLSDAPRTTQKYPVEIIVPNGTELISLEPQTVSVRVR